MQILPACHAQQCPPSSDPGGVNGCYCPIGSFCGSNQCALAVNGSYLFPNTCMNCSCVLGLLVVAVPVVMKFMVTICLMFMYFSAPEPTVHAVYSPTYGSVWYIGSSYTILWYSTNLPTVDILLLVLDTTGNVALVSTIASNTTNSGTFVWTIPSGTVAATNGYFVTVRPPGRGSTDLDGYSRSPPFSVSVQPAGACLPGYTSATGSYPNCTMCPKGTYVWLT